MSPILPSAAIVAALLISLGSVGALAQKSGGVLKMPNFASPASMSIHEEITRAAITALMPVFNNLVLFDQHKAQNTIDTIVPDLADSWSWDAAKTALTFKLRHGVKWHDGKPFTAAAYGLPGQAPEQRDGVNIQSAKSSKVGQDSTGVDNG